MRTFGMIPILVGLIIGTTNPLANYSAPRIGTAIIAIVYPESRIVVAADSKRRFLAFDEKKTESENFCKISKLSDSIFFVVAGFNGWRSFRVYDTVRWAYLEASNLGEAIQLTETRLKTRIEMAHVGIRNKSPDFYRREFNTLEKVNVAFFGAQNGKLFFNRREFKARNLSHEIVVDITRQNCPGDACPKGHGLFVSGGKSDGITQYLTNNPIPLRLTEQVNWINNAMNAQIKATPQDVGGPINIISINPAGEMQWIQGEDQCKL
jgi:hypothetical protein